jgi:hypothetical protein
MSETIKILYLSASPNDQQKLSVDEEFRAIHEKVETTPFKLISVSGTRASELQTVVLENNPEIIHFSGHSSSDDVLFESEDRKSQGVPKNAIVNFFNNLEKKPRLVFFNACRTAENLESLSRLIDFVVVTERAVFDDTAVIFATRFYQFLSRGGSVKSAFNHAKNEFAINPVHGRETREAAFKVAENQSDIESLGTEAEMYKLFIREGVDPDKSFIEPLNPEKNAGAEQSAKKTYTVNINGGNIEKVNNFQDNDIETITFN